MYYQKYQLVLAYYRDTVDLKRYMADITKAIRAIFCNDAKNIVIADNYYSFELPYKPTKTELRSLGEHISYYSPGLRQYVIQRTSSRTLFKCVERNYKL